ncbi:MAG: helix-turn-helix domain-containing protein [Candidatus Omnitrophica bacterium]|nr:helix-turn-helix domain-containing protein [Candidatus Omnitrophota bacterium]MDD5654852.1 helix-turn-helix domain-containing protein [Candidatus Omnitrophota bacterium]
MTEEKLLTIREVSQMLHISEKDVIDLSEAGKIPAYKVGGVYLRFKRDQVERFSKHSSELDAIKEAPKEDTLKEGIKDFIYFHDFYLAAAFIMLVMLVVIFKG